MKIRRSALGAVLAACCVFGVATATHAADLPPLAHSLTMQAPKAAPALKLKGLDGKMHDLAQLRGRVVLINYWATWCPPCREEMPEFVKAQQELGPRGLQFVGIAIDDAAKAEAFAAELGLNYPVLIGGYGAIELSRAFGNRLGALPFTIIVDRAGRISHTQLGPIKDAQLRTIVSQLL